MQNKNKCKNVSCQKPITIYDTINFYGYCKDCYYELFVRKNHHNP